MSDVDAVPIPLVGDGLLVPCVDGQPRPYLNLDATASTNALPSVAQRVHEFVPWYSSVHRGAGYKSRMATTAYEEARAAALQFAGRRPGGQDVAVICRNTTEAINHPAYRLRLEPADMIVTTVVEHHANLLPWASRTRRPATTGQKARYLAGARPTGPWAHLREGSPPTRSCGGDSS